MSNDKDKPQPPKEPSPPPTRLIRDSTGGKDKDRKKTANQANSADAKSRVAD